MQWISQYSMKLVIVAQVGQVCGIIDLLARSDLTLFLIGEDNQIKRHGRPAVLNP